MVKASHKHFTRYLANSLRVCTCVIFVNSTIISSWAIQPEHGLPLLRLPDDKIAEVYCANWINTLEPCTQNLLPADPKNPYSESNRPWKVDVDGHYPGWYPAVDVKHQAAAYLACGNDLPRVLRAWVLTTRQYLTVDGAIKLATMADNPHGVWPEATGSDATVFYPLRATGAIDYLILGDIIFRYTQDKDWLQANLPAMRRARDFLDGLMDHNGLLLSYSYDLDQVYRQIDGVAQASAYFALNKLAALEQILDNLRDAEKAAELARKVKDASNAHFWDAKHGYYCEHLEYNNIAQFNRLGAVMSVSSERKPKFAATKALDGVVGMGTDAFRVGIGTAGNHEWSTDGETKGAWIQIGLQKPTAIAAAILVNRTGFDVQPGERFAKGYLDFSDGSPRVEVSFSNHSVSRAFVSFQPRTVTWVRFVGTEMQGTEGSNAGLAEFALLPDDAPYEKHNHGMTDTNLAMLAFGIADNDRAAQIWDYFRANESSFYEVNGLFAPTWIAEKADTYKVDELNKRAPYKDCVALARIWRYDALMRRRMNDGAGIYRTIRYANALFDRPSGGGVGWFAERYDLGRFRPGDEPQLTVPKYAGYPAIYNSTIIQEALLGLSADVHGVIHIAPCVPEEWYRAGFGQNGCGVLDKHRLGFSYYWDRVEGFVSGPQGEKALAVQLPPGLGAKACKLTVDGRRAEMKVSGQQANFTLYLSEEGRQEFTLEADGEPG